MDSVADDFDTTGVDILYSSATACGCDVEEDGAASPRIMPIAKDSVFVSGRSDRGRGGAGGDWRTGDMAKMECV